MTIERRFSSRPATGNARYVLYSTEQPAIPPFRAMEPLWPPTPCYVWLARLNLYPALDALPDATLLVRSALLDKSRLGELGLGAPEKGCRLLVRTDGGWWEGHLASCNPSGEGMRVAVLFAIETELTMCSRIPASSHACSQSPFRHPEGLIRRCRRRTKLATSKSRQRQVLAGGRHHTAPLAPFPGRPGSARAAEGRDQPIRGGT